MIEHLSNPGLFLENAHRHLRSGGLLILTTPNAYSLRIITEMILKGQVDILNLSRALKEGEHVLWHSEEDANWKTKFLTAILLRVVDPKFFAPRLVAIFRKSSKPH